MSHQLGPPCGVRRVPVTSWALFPNLPAAWTSLLWGPALFAARGSALTCAFISCPTRVRVRYQKRQKLQFETKLGMNSPF